MLNRVPRPFIALISLLASCCLIAGIGFHALRNEPTASRENAPKNRPPTRLLPRPCKVADGFYLLGHTFPAAVYAIETRDGLILIDSGLEGEHDKIVHGLTSLGLEATRVKMILLTHAHGDHSMGAERLRRETGCPVYVGREDAAPLREGGPWEAIFSKFDMPGETTHPTTVDGELSDGQVLTLGEARITAIATPGHTRGSFCYLIEHRGQRALATGDTVMSLSDGLGTYATYLPPKYRGNVDEYLGSLRKLRGLSAPDLVLPGHPTSDEVPQDPRLTSHQWEALLDRGIIELEILAERYLRDGADFLDGTPKELAEGLFYLGDLGGNAAYALVLSSDTLLFDAAGGDDSPEFLAAAWKELGVEPPPVAAVALTSCRAEKLTGLRALIDATHCRVVTSPEGAEIVTAHCPDVASIVAIDDAARFIWSELRALATPGWDDDTAVTYYFRLGGAMLLVSGDAMVETRKAAPPSGVSGMAGAFLDLPRWSAWLDALEPVRPNLWLSAHPLHGRNANMYEFEWERVLASNREMLRRYRVMKQLSPAPGFR
jgi:glyoxylase-like metal-dependent hydrolase (beta-lactamase superfamily II)